MTILSTRTFNGLKPIVDPRLLGESDAQIARNVRLISGSMEPMRGAADVQALHLYQPKTIFKFGDKWLEFQLDTDVMRSPIPNDPYDRVYWTDGSSLPRYAPASMVTSSQPYPGASYQLGLPAPSAPTVASIGTSTTGQTFTITESQINSITWPTTLKFTVTTSAGSTDYVREMVTAGTLETVVESTGAMMAATTNNNLVITPNTGVLSVSIFIKTGTADDYSTDLVTYESYLQPGDSVDAVSSDRVFSVLDGSMLRGLASPAVSAAILFSPAVIAAMTPGQRLAVQVNSDAQVSVTAQAGSGTYPAAVTPQSLAAALSSVSGLRTEVRENASYVIDGSTVTGTFVVAYTTLTGSSATLKIRKIIPAQTNVYSTARNWTYNNTVDVTRETRVYVVNYVSAYGEEGPPSAASSAVQLAQGQSCSLGLPGAPSGNYNVTLKRIYRSSTVGSQAQFQFVADVPVAQAEFVDNIDQADLGEVMPSENWVAPPEDLRGLRMMANGAAVGFSGRTVYFSEPNMPHAWPHKYTIDYDIIGIATYGQTVAVLTTAFPFLLQGADPAAMTPNKLEIPQACASKRSIVETGDGVVYASPDGLVSIGASADVITRSLLSREQWQAYSPSTMECYLYNGRLHVMVNATSGRDCLVIDPTGQGAVLTTLSINTATPVTAGYYDPTADKLYMARGSQIVAHDQVGNQEMTWRGRVNRLPWQQNMAVGQVRADAYPLSLRVYADGVQVMNRTVDSQDHFTLPGGFRAIDWEVEVVASSRVREITLATSVSELKAV